LRTNNTLAESAGWEDDALRIELAELQDADFDLELLGFSDDELRVLLAQAGEGGRDRRGAGRAIPEAPVEPVTRPGDRWRIGRHRLLCSDCRDLAAVERLLDGAKANLVVTPPPYATQRLYDPASGFQPVRPEVYCDWFRPVAANIAAILALDGSCFLNIKEHAEDGEHSLYVKDLMICFSPFLPSRL
jgi:hypothetical protein